MTESERRFKIGVSNKTMLTGLFFSLFAIYCCHSSEDLQDEEQEIFHENGEKFAGSAQCKNCHLEIYQDHLLTAHYNTSAIATEHSVKGSFTDSNALDLQTVRFEMIQRSDSLMVSTTIKNRNVEVPDASFDLVVGSGVKGQSYMTWQGDQLIQLQPSYYTPTNSWINSPGFKSFYTERPITANCLKCHFTYVTPKNEANFADHTFDKHKIIKGIDCERCHRPAASHVQYHQNNPQDTVAQYMLDLSRLDETRRIDICAQCHAGLRERTIKGNAFSFLAGDNLSDFTQNFAAEDVSSDLDVHGNQVGLLVQSKCFTESDGMDCITCHNPHRNQRGLTEYFNDKCIGCHQNGEECGENINVRLTADDNCIHCHMPLAASTTMLAELSENVEKKPFYVRNHRIAVYK